MLAVEERDMQMELLTELKLKPRHPAQAEEACKKIDGTRRRSTIDKKGRLATAAIVCVIIPTGHVEDQRSLVPDIFSARGVHE